LCCFLSNIERIFKCGKQLMKTAHTIITNNSVERTVDDMKPSCVCVVDVRHLSVTADALFILFFLIPLSYQISQSLFLCGNAIGLRSNIILEI